LLVYRWFTLKKVKKLKKQDVPLEEEFKIVDPEMPIIKEKCKKKDI